MEASNLSTMFFKPWVNQPTFIRRANELITSDTRETRHLPGSCIGMLFRPRFLMCLHKRSSSVSGGNVRVGAELLPVFHGQNPRAVPLWLGPRSPQLISCRVTTGESGGTLNGENILLDEQTLERELQIAIQEENYAEAAKIRDNLKLLQEDCKASVLAANAKFYNSFRNGDLAAMQALWSKGEQVCVVHPGVSGISGHDLVMGSWEFVWADYEFPLEIEIKDVQVHVSGNVGYVTCIEMVRTKGSSWGRHFATNVFEKVDDQWFICIHHASYVDL